MTEYAHVDGELCELGAATVSVRDRGFLYGDAAFETIRVYGGQPFAWDAHMDRLEGTCASLEIDHDISRADLQHRVEETLAANELTEAYVRLSITRGVQSGRLTPESAVDPTVVILVEPLPRGGSGGESVWAQPAAVTISSTQRIPDEAIPARAKTHNYLNGILARLTARTAEADEAIMPDARGALTEGATSNLFLVDGSTLQTPDVVDCPVLPGITREVVLQLADELEYNTTTTTVYPRDITEADEVFLTNTTWEIRPVASVNGERIPSGPVTEALIDAFDARVDAICYADT